MIDIPIYNVYANGTSATKFENEYSVKISRLQLPINFCVKVSVVSQLHFQLR